MAVPSMSAASSAKSGDIGSTSSFMGGDFAVNFGSTPGGGFDLGGLVTNYWPLLAVVGVVWYIKRKKG